MLPEHHTNLLDPMGERLTSSLRNPMALRLSRNDTASLAELVSQAATACGRKVDLAQINESLVGPGTGRTRLVRAAAASGLRISTVTLSIAEAAERSAVDAPLFALVGESAFCSFEGIDSGLVLVVDDRGERQRLSLDLAAKKLGLADASNEALFLELDPAFPHGEEPSDHGHGHHHDSTPEQRLRALLSIERGDVWAIFVYGALVGLASLAMPIAVQALVSSVAMGTMLQPVLVLSIVLTVVLTFSSFLRVAQVKLVELLQERLFVRAAMRVTARFSRVTANGFGGEHGPEQANRFMDILTIQKAASGLLLDGLGLALQLVIGLALLGFYHPFLLAFDVVLVGSLLFVVLVLGRSSVKTAIDESRAKYGVVAWIEEIARHSHTFRSFSGRAFAMDRTDALLNEYLAARRRHFRILLRQIVGSLVLHTMASAGVLGLGAVLVLQQQLTLGQLVAAEIVVNSVVAGISKIGKHLEAYYDLLAALDKVGHLEEVPTERDDGSSPDGSTPLGVTFEWRGQRLSVAPGERVAVRRGLDLGDLVEQEEGAASVTRSEGSEPVDFMDSLYGFNEEGAVRVDGVPTTELSLAGYREQVALVRGPEIFAGTVADNVRVGRKEVSLGDVRRALRDVGLDELVAGLGRGIHSELTTYGAPLSPEQATRLVLARAAVGRPRLLLLDGTLDGLPDVARSSILGWLEKKRGDFTVVLSTNRSDVELACDSAAKLGVHGVQGARS